MKPVAPGVYSREIDFSLYVPTLSSTIVGMVGTATKGPINVPTLITNVPAFIRTFGNPSPSHYMPYAALEYLRRGKQIYIVRVSGTDAVEASATFNAFKPAILTSTDVDQIFTISSGTANLRVVVTDARTTPSTVYDGTVTLTTGSYSTAAAMATQIATKLSRSPMLSEVVTAIAHGTTPTLKLVTTAASTAVSVKTLAAATNDASVALGLDPAGAGTEASGTAAGSFQIKSSSVGSHGNFINVQVTSKPGWKFDVGVYEGTALNTYGYRTELHTGVSLNDGDAKWVGDVLGTDAEEGASVALTFVTTPADTVPPADDLVMPEVKTTALTGGDDGLNSVIPADYIGVSSPTKTGLQLFRSSKELDLNIICVPGISNPSVINEMLALCEERSDAIAIVDTPDNYTFQQVIDWHNGVGAFADHQSFNSSYGAMYWPWLQIYDPYNGVDVWTPPSGHVAAVYAYTDYIAETWFAPAGLNRAHIVAAKNVRHVADDGMVEALYGNQNAINPIVKFPKDGITIWGQRTLQRAPTARDRVNVRRLLNYAKKVIATAAKYLLFEPNDDTTWRQFSRLVEPFFDSIRARRGVYDFRVICDETTNTPLNIDQSIMTGRIYFQPTKAAEIINIDYVLTPTGADFDEFLF